MTLAEALSAAGYRTAAFVANTAVVRADQGFDQGFDEYFELNATQPYVQGEEVTRAVHDWLVAGSLADRGANDAPVFLYVHYMDPHTPYTQGAASNPSSDTKAVAEYAAELTYLDTHLADLLIGVKRQLSGQTAILVTWTMGRSWASMASEVMGTRCTERSLEYLRCCRLDGRQIRVLFQPDSKVEIFLTWCYSLQTPRMPT